jgi:hypothetical protein
MASSINASTAGVGGVITTADNTGILNLQSGGTTVATVSSTGLATTGITNSALTSGRVPFASTGGLLADSASLTYDGTTLTSTKFAGAFNGSLGATTPSTVVGTSILSTGGSATVQARLNGSDSFAGGPTIGLTNTAANRIWFTQLSASNNYDWWYYNGSAESKLATLNTSGNLGLGVTPSAWGTGHKVIQLESFAALDGNNGATYLANNWYSNAGNKYIGTGLAALYAQSSGVHYWYTAPSGTAGNAITFTTAMTVDSNGVKINASFGGSTFPFRVGYTTGGTYYPQMTMNDSGNLFLSNNITPTAYGRLTSISNTGTPAGRFQGSSSMADGSIALMVDKYSSTSTTSQWFLGFTITNTTVASGVITANGASQAAFGSWSDRRLKENIVDLAPQLDNILALRPVEFDYIESEGGGHQISFIAQEFEEIYPDAIGERQDGMKTLTGWSKTEARLVKAIQEQQALIDELKAIVDTQAEQIKALQGAA